jgi:hypothetical protein
MATRRQQEERRRNLRPHPVRDEVIDLLQNSNTPLSPTQMSRFLGVTLGSLAYHVRTLVAAGVLVLVDEGRVRGAVEHYYTLASHQPLPPASDPVRVALALSRALSVSPPGDGPPLLTELDPRGRDEIQELVDRFALNVRSVALSSTLRANA